MAERVEQAARSWRSEGASHAVGVSHRRAKWLDMVLRALKDVELTHRRAQGAANRQTSPRRRGVALYCYYSVKKREVSSNETRHYLDCVGFAHRGGVY